MSMGEEVKKLFFTDTLGVGGCIAAHPVGSTTFTQTPPPLVSVGYAHAKAGHVVTSSVGPKSSTPIVPVSGSDPLTDLRDLITELGNQIGDFPPINLFGRHPSQFLLWWAVTAVTLWTTDAREPAVFRGEGSDKCTVQEWIEMMEVYLKKKKCPASDQADEIMSHLMGKAKKIVKVGSSSIPDNAVQTETIYEILRRYFSESPASCFPLADFYATQPSVGENPVDYWVRLNTAADQADRHLKMQGRKFENMSAVL